MGVEMKSIATLVEEKIAALLQEKKFSEIYILLEKFSQARTRVDGLLPTKFAYLMLINGHEDAYQDFMRLKELILFKIMLPEIEIIPGEKEIYEAMLVPETLEIYRRLVEL